MSTTTSPRDAALDGLPAKPRVHELAKRSGASSREIITALADRGVTVTSASSSVDRDIALAVLTELLGEPGPAASDVAGSAVADPAVDTSADSSGDTAAPADSAVTSPLFLPPQPPTRSSSRRRRGRSKAADDETDQPTLDTTGAVEAPTAVDLAEPAEGDDADAEDGQVGDGQPGEGSTSSGRKRRRRGRRGRGRVADDGDETAEDETTEASAADGTATADPAAADVEGEQPEDDTDDDEAADDEDRGAGTGSRRRRRRRRRTVGDDPTRPDDPENTVVHVRESREARPVSDEVQGIKGSTRLEAKRQRRRDARGSSRRPQILTEAEFLARREAVDRVMAVRQRGPLAQVALLEDNILVEHFVSRAGSASLIGNVYLGKVQNVLPSMEAAFVDIGRGRNAVLYAGEVNWDASGLVGKTRRIEAALSSGDAVLVQVSKDPVGHKGARLTTQISLPGRFLVYVPGGGATGISRKLPDTERKRLKAILDRIVPDGAGVIIRTAAEGVPEEELVRDVERLTAQWEEISQAAENTSSAPAMLSVEPDTLIKVVRDLFNSDIHRLVVDGDDAWDAISGYVESVAPELADRVSRFTGSGDVFGRYRIDEQIAKALERKVHLPSGGSLVIDRTEAMTVIDVNTGKYTGSGGNLEETVTRNNLEAAEEVVRQLRLRDIGGIIVVDFIDMVLESNRDLVLRRLTECLGRDRTRHQVAEVTSLGLIQMTRKKMGTGLVEAFSEPCPHCGGRGIVLHDLPKDTGTEADDAGDGDGRSGRGRRNRGKRADADREPAVRIATVLAGPKPDPRGPKPPSLRGEGAENGPPSADEVGAVLIEGPDVAVVVPESAAGEVAADVADQVTEATLAADETVGLSDGESVAGVLAEADAAVAAVELAQHQPAQYQPAQDEPTEEPSSRPARPRRRRAAGRPAGAPSESSVAVDIVLPATPEAAAGPELRSPEPTSPEPTSPEPTSPEPTSPERTSPEPTGAAPSPDTVVAAPAAESAGSETTGDAPPPKSGRRRSTRTRKPATPSADGQAADGQRDVPSSDATPEPAMSTTVATPGESVPAKAAPRRRRAASRPAGPAGEQVSVPAIPVTSGDGSSSG